MIKLITTPSGHKSAIINGIALHSQYDPQKEANRFIKNTIADSIPSLIIVLGAGIGHLINSIKQLYPHVKLIAIFYSEEIFINSFLKHDLYWHPHCKQSLISFLRENMHELEAEGFKMVEWPPSATIFPYIARKALLQIKQLIKENTASLLTTIAHGRLWLRNSLYNFLVIDNPLTGNPIKKGLPIIIAASGPWLKQALDIIYKYRQNINLWALPSAVHILAEYQLTPDYIFLTDPGYYSSYYLHFIKQNNLKIVMPISAARGSWRIKAKIFYISQSDLLEKQIFKNIKTPVPQIMPYGTVAATALNFALQFSNHQRIIFIGLDMCYKNILSHARPHAFDALFYNSQTKYSPYLNQVFYRAMQMAPDVDKKRGIRTSSPLQTYAGWFQTLSRTKKQRVFRLIPSPLVIQGIGNLNKQDFVDIIIKQGRTFNIEPEVHPIDNYPSYTERRKILTVIIKAWLSDIKGLTHRISANRYHNVMTNPRILNLIYFIMPREIAEIKRKVRYKGMNNMKQDLQDLIDKAIQYLNGFLQKLSKTGN